jgi:hypothetical protein
MRIVCAALLLSGGLAFAHQQTATATSAKAFEQLKTLVGRWEGTTTDNGTPHAAVVEFSLTANGSALVEKMFPGTPHEMMTVYTGAPTLALTHYCTLGNQPRMELAGAGGGMMQFVLAKGDSGVNAKDSHMHSLALAFTDANDIVETWHYYEGGVDKGTTVFTLKRAEDHRAIDKKKFQ